MLWCYKYSGGNKTGQICSMCIIGYSCWISTANFSSFSSKIPSSRRIVYMVCDEVFIINLNSNWYPTARLSGDLWFSVVSAFPRVFPMETGREMTKLTEKDNTLNQIHVHLPQYHIIKQWKLQRFGKQSFFILIQYSFHGSFKIHVPVLKNPLFWMKYLHVQALQESTRNLLLSEHVHVWKVPVYL